MQELPHHYRVRAQATAGSDVGDVELIAERLPVLRSASPAEFGGPGDRWSPETLLVGAVADCFTLTFRAIARASKLPWSSLQCEATGTLDKIDRVQFTRFDIRARLVVPAGTNSDLASRALEKAERSCLISNSLNAEVHLDAVVAVAAEPIGALTGVAG
jgi:organic hydroperoxide reductase OsmC/OhrA